MSQNSSRSNPQEIRVDDLNHDKLGVFNIFENIDSEVKVAKLKRLIMRDKYWHDRILSVRKKINSKVDNPGTMPNNPELLALYYELIEEKVLNRSGVEKKLINLEKENESLNIEESDYIKKFESVIQILKRLKVRSNSGVAVISLLTKPYTCPGRCIYCPTEKNMPKSYLSREPAAARALLNRFDPYKQISMRLRALTMNGHPVDKVEMIMIGGTWNFYPKEYQEWFTKESFRACNNWKSVEEGREFLEANHTKTLEELQIINESAHARIIGLSIETRPDYITESELKWLRILGVTKVELGVQHLDQGVLDFNKREMTAKSIAEGSEMLRDYGFKVVYHMMPNLPTSNPEMDVEAFRQLYNGLDHHPDMMKIYPCMVLRGSLLYKMVTQNKIEYKAYDDITLTHVLADCEKYVPNYTRLIRVIRDIPADYIIIGSKKSNLREDVDKYQQARGVPQVDIRAREIRDRDVDPKDFNMTETWYETRHGYECFLQFENEKDARGQNKLAGFLRLRLPKFAEIEKDVDNKTMQIEMEKEDIENGNKISDVDEGKSLEILNTKKSQNWGLEKWYKETEEFAKLYPNKISELLASSALVRELHVYGTMRRVGEEGNQSQHTGMGKALLKRAEEIAGGDNIYFKNNLIPKYNKLAIISGIGVREYYRKRGYHLEETYMVKGI